MRAPTRRTQVLAGATVALAACGMMLFVSCAQRPFRRLPLRVRTGTLLAPPLMRVLIWSGPAREGPTVACEGSCVVVAEGLEGGSLRLPALPPSPVALRDGSLMIGETAVRATQMTLMALDEAPLQVADRAYRGAVLISAEGDGTIRVVNTVDLETYLLGVLPSEMPSRWPLEALKAQAVAARTYALARRKANQGRPYHVAATTADQVYAGWMKPMGNVEAAVKQTRGIAMFHEGRLFTAYFHRTCGGHTADAARVLSAPDAAFIQGVPCPFCTDSKYYTWRAEIPRDELESLLHAAGYDLPTSYTLSLRTSGAEGTVEQVVFRGGGRRLLVPGARFREICGADRIKSQRFDAVLEADALIVEGRGWGHGVGLCQYGARGAALAYWPYDAILAHYYGDVELVQIYD